MSHHERKSRPKAMTLGHQVRLLLLNLVLFVTIAAFAVLVTGSYNEMSPGHWTMMAILVVGAAVVGVVSTAMHVKKGTWTSVDDMAERF
jgi:hypothetical protein